MMTVARQPHQVLAAPHLLPSCGDTRHGQASLFQGCLPDLAPSMSTRILSTNSTTISITNVLSVGVVAGTIAVPTQHRDWWQRVQRPETSSTRVRS